MTSLASGRRALARFVLAPGLLCCCPSAMGQENPSGEQGATATAPAQTDAAANPDEAAIRKSADDFTEAFNRQDAATLAALWTPNGLYVDESGRIFDGREAIKEVYEQFFADHTDAKIQLSVNGIRVLSPTAAIEEGAASLTDATGTTSSASQYTAVHVKQEDGSWLLASVQDSPAKAASPIDHLQHLDILTGEWTANHAGAEATVTGKWNPQKTFVERHFVVTKDGEALSSTTEVIGWNPLTGQITSWTFSSTGGRSIGAWLPLEDGWIVTNTGITGDGAPTFSIDAWAPLLGDALGWKSTQRFVGGRPVHDARHVVLKKKTSDAAPAN